ncbi:MAG: hypothetical protein B5766_05425 [Candidatus Lumbricidophila eiseniae]|uniref:Calcineurin-like phosphoesterase domain-containing protein n=1 Tax=Candidatus Lumbricidiphila eiseniae TaxID=1969409 RepID=A0A2A6FS46_9MICO|nr:MAG: hypothetical protein B5766_05425 [Candidatus Lumbricidophila eiseniae]
MTRVLFTSDPHLTHPLLAKIRGFITPDGQPDVTAHDAWYTQMWCQNVTKRDLVFVLGDLTTGGTKREFAALQLMASLPGRKVLIAGNHDRVHPMHRDSIQAGLQSLWLETFDAVMPFGLQRFTVNGERRYVHLSHFPYSGDHTETDRYDQWRLKDTGRWLLHGHTHDENQRLHNGHQIHVGIEAWGRPVNKDELTRLIETAETASCG